METLQQVLGLPQGLFPFDVPGTLLGKWVLAHSNQTLKLSLLASSDMVGL